MHFSRRRRRVEGRVLYTNFLSPSFYRTRMLAEMNEREHRARVVYDSRSFSPKARARLKSGKVEFQVHEL